VYGDLHEGRTKGSHFSGELGPDSIVLEALDGKLLFAQCVFGIHPGGVSLEKDMEFGSRRFAVISQTTTNIFLTMSSDSDSFSDGGPAQLSTKYVITDALKAPRATTYTAQALFDQIMSGDIDLDPEYQRGPSFLPFFLSTHSLNKDIVWPEAKQVGLIDSIFRNFYIPPVIFGARSLSLFPTISHVFPAVSAHEDGSEHRICIDGKQRLTSIYRFMLGLVSFFLLTSPTH